MNNKPTTSELEKKVLEWREKRAAKLAERLQRNSGKRREVSSMVLGLRVQKNIQLLTPPRTVSDLRLVPPKKVPLRKSLSLGDVNVKQLNRNGHDHKVSRMSHLGGGLKKYPQKVNYGASVSGCKRNLTPAKPSKTTSEVSGKDFKAPTKSAFNTKSNDPNNPGASKSVHFQDEVVETVPLMTAVPSVNQLIPSNETPNLVLDASTEEKLNSTYLVDDDDDLTCPATEKLADPGKVSIPENVSDPEANIHTVVEESQNCNIVVNVTEYEEPGFPSSSGAEVNTDAVPSSGAEVNTDSVPYPPVGIVPSPERSNEFEKTPMKNTEDNTIVGKIDSLYITPLRSGRKSRVLVDSTNIVESSSIKYVLREIKNKETGTPVVLMTPVRRSTRRKAENCSFSENSKLNGKVEISANKVEIVPNLFLNS